MTNIELTQLRAPTTFRGDFSSQPPHTKSNCNRESRSGDLFFFFTEMRNRLLTRARNTRAGKKMKHETGSRHIRLVVVVLFFPSTRIVIRSAYRSELQFSTTTKTRSQVPFKFNVIGELRCLPTKSNDISRFFFFFKFWRGKAQCYFRHLPSGRSWLGFSLFTTVQFWTETQFFPQSKKSREKGGMETRRKMKTKGNVLILFRERPRRRPKGGERESSHTEQLDRRVFWCVETGKRPS